MPTVTNPKTGETEEISMEEFMKMMRSGGKLEGIQQIVTDASGNQRVTDIYGNISGRQDGLDHSVNIFVPSTDMGYFLRSAFEGALGEQKLDDGYVMTVDWMDKAITCVVTSTKERLCLETFARDERKSNSGESAKHEWEKENGVMDISLERIQEDKQLAYGVIYGQMRKFLQAEGLLAKLKEMDNRSCGVVIKLVDGEPVAKLVRGKERPDLPCQIMGGLLGEDMCRPYVDELVESALIGDMSPEELIAEAEDGNEEAMETLALAYLNGDDVEQDFVKAAYWTEKLAESENSIAQFNIGLYYAKGCGVPRDFEKAAHWLEKAAENGDEDAPVLAEKCRKAIKDAAKAEAGEAQAQADLAAFLMFLGGSLDQYGGQHDFAESFQWAQRAAQQGNPEGMWALALCYEHGRGTKKNVNTAISWYRKGTELGHAPSQHSLACYYMRGDVLQEDRKQAFDLFMKSAKQGYALALKAVGRCYQFGHGVEDSMPLAIEWYEKALQVEPDPELERKVEVFKMLEESSNLAAESDYVPPEGYMEALQAAMAQENARDSHVLATAMRNLDGVYDPDKETLVFTQEVVGTQYEGRTQRIENVRVGDVLHLVREPNNADNDKNISVRNRNGESLGNLSASACQVLAPVMDEKLAQKITAKVCEVVPLSKRGGRAKKAILKLTITLELEGAVFCLICKLAGDQVNTWAQHLTVSYSMMPTDHAGLLFELYNRFMGEYDNWDKGENDTSYAGLDNLEEEIRAAREKMQAQRVEGLDYSRGEISEQMDFGQYVLLAAAEDAARYGVLKEYGIEEFDRLEDILEGSVLAQKDYYWLDQTRVSEEEFNEVDGYNHWYEVLELYHGKSLPVDLNDEDVVSIFGCDKFAAFADLSYGC